MLGLVMGFIHDFMVIPFGHSEPTLRPSPRRSSGRLVSVKKENLQLANVARSAEFFCRKHRQPKTPLCQGEHLSPDLL